MRLASQRSITLRKRHTTPVVNTLTCLYSVKVQPWDHVMLDYVSYVYVQSTATRGVSRDSYGQLCPLLERHVNGICEVMFGISTQPGTFKQNLALKRCRA
jgi:hypothetical protein